MSEASLRISEGPDFDTVLHGVLDSARSLIGARYGVVALLDDSGSLQDLHFSGTTDTEAELFHQLPEGMQLFEYLSRLPQPLRLQNLLEHIRSTEHLLDLRPPIAVGPVVPSWPPPCSTGAIASATSSWPRSSRVMNSPRGTRKL